MAEAYDEHATADGMVRQLRGMGPEDSRVQPMLRDLLHQVAQPVQEEEGEMLPQAEELMLDDLDRLGEEMMARKEQMMATARQTARRGG